MTAILNNPGCASFGGNTGIGNCDFNLKDIQGIIVVDKAFTLLAATLVDVPTLEAALKVSVNAAGTLRIFPITGFDDPEVKSTEIGRSESAFGRSSLTRRGKYNLVSRLAQGGQCFFNELRKFNGDNSKRVYLWTSDNYLVGTKSGTADMKGASVDFIHTHDSTLPDGKDISKTMLEIQFSDNRELNEDIAYVKMSDSMNDIVKGVINVEVSKLSQGAATATMQVFTKCDKTNLYDSFSALLASAAAWNITKAGVAVVPVSVAAVPATKSWIITLTAPTGAHVIDLVNCAALDALGVGGDPDNGFESTGAVTVTFA